MAMDTSRSPPSCLAGGMVLENLLTPAELERIRDGLASAPFRDGRVTAGASARQVKNNEQARGDDPVVTELARMVRGVLDEHGVFQALVRPVRWSNLMFSRYTQGHRYGLHTDDASMRDDRGYPFRTDVSFTIFASDRDAYTGGALRILGAGGDGIFRPSAGSAVIYPTGLIHEVTPVTSGTRLACVGWVQSSVRRTDQRELLFDLACARGALTENDARLLLDKTIGNLLRMWAET